MEKIDLKGKTIGGDKLLVLAVDKIQEIVGWIAEYERQHTKKSPGKTVQRLDKYSDKPEVLRYELSNDKVGLVAYLAGGISYHIHSDELTPEQRLIKIELLGMEG